MKKALKDEELRSKVLNILNMAGFKTIPKKPGDKGEYIVKCAGKSKPVDIWIDYDGLKIIFECTGEKDFSISAFVADKMAVAEQAKAKLVLVITQKDIDEENRGFIKNQGISLWTKKELDYYDAIVGTIGEWARHEIIHFLGLETKEDKDVTNVLSLKIKQPLKTSKDDVYLFAFPPERLLKTAVIFRKAVGESTTYQRILDKTRLPGIAKYLVKNDILFPVDLIVSLSDKVTSTKIKDGSFSCEDGIKYHDSLSNAEVHLLKIPMEYGSLEIIDGQHRLFGFTKVADNKILKNFNLIVAAIKSPTNEQKKDIFVAINSKAKKMDPNLVAYLEYVDEEEKCREDSKLMAIKIVVKLSEASPFKGIIRLYDLGDEPITLKGFAGYTLKSLVGKKGLLRKYYNNDSSEYLKSIRQFFNTLKSIIGNNKWDDICSNRVVSALLMLLHSTLSAIKRKYDIDDLKKYLAPLKSFDFSKKAMKGKYIGASGWRKLHSEMVKSISSKYKEFRE
ncbi:MAG: DGQHR domain-containing protein [Candidatus Saganbacteria bacterium]|nr:DGQHR domain-containing protein [Candidatus Saganbacteria bacterium]